MAVDGHDLYPSKDVTMEHHHDHHTNHRRIALGEHDHPVL